MILSLAGATSDALASGCGGHRGDDFSGNRSGATYRTAHCVYVLDQCPPAGVGPRKRCIMLNFTEFLAVAGLFVLRIGVPLLIMVWACLPAQASRSPLGGRGALARAAPARAGTAGGSTRRAATGAQAGHRRAGARATAAAPVASAARRGAAPCSAARPDGCAGGAKRAGTSKGAAKAQGRSAPRRNAPMCRAGRPGSTPRARSRKSASSANHSNAIRGCERDA